MPEELASRLFCNIDSLRLLMKEYSQLDEEAKKLIRAQLYRRLGGFAKIVLADVPEFEQLELDLLNKGKGG